MSILVTQPILLWLIWRVKWRDLKFTTKALLVGCSLILLLVILFYASGYRHYGYRYAMDFIPILFVILMAEYRRQHPAGLTSAMKRLMFISAIINSYLFSSWFFLG
jgi:Gpi18-like mannosyltransferase